MSDQNVEQQTATEEQICVDQQEINRENEENGFELLSAKEIETDNTIGVIEIIEGNEEGIDTKKIEDHCEGNKKGEDQCEGNKKDKDHCDGNKKEDEVDGKKNLDDKDNFEEKRKGDEKTNEQIEGSKESLEVRGKTYSISDEDEVINEEISQNYKECKKLIENLPDHKNPKESSKEEHVETYEGSKEEECVKKDEENLKGKGDEIKRKGDEIKEKEDEAKREESEVKQNVSVNLNDKITEEGETKSNDDEIENEEYKSSEENIARLKNSDEVSFHKKVFRQTISPPSPKTNRKTMDSIDLSPIDYDDYDPNFVNRKEFYFNIISLILYTTNILAHVFLGIKHFKNHVFSGFFTMYFIFLTNIYSSNISEATNVFKYVVSPSRPILYWMLRVISTIFALTPVIQHITNIKLINKSLASVDDATKTDFYYSYKRMKYIVYKIHGIIRYLEVVPQMCLQVFIAVNMKSSSGIHTFCIVIAVLYKMWIELHEHGTFHLLCDRKWRKFIGAMMKGTGNFVPILCRIVCMAFILTHNDLMKWTIFFSSIVHCSIAIIYKHFSTNEYDRSFLTSSLQGISLTIKPEILTFKSNAIQNVIFQIEDSLMIVLWYYISHNLYKETYDYLYIVEAVMIVDIFFRVVQAAHVKIKDYFIDEEDRTKFALAEL